MLEHLESGAPPLKISQEIFSRHFPNGKIQAITLELVPLQIQRLVKRPFGSVAFKVAHIDESSTFGATGGFGGKVLLQDRDDADRYVGEGNIEPDHIDEFGIPIDGYTFTAERERKKGLGMRRLLVMNALSHMFFKLPLNSSSYQELPANLSLWERLATEGKAERYQGLLLPRYRFTI